MKKDGMIGIFAPDKAAAISLQTGHTPNFFQNENNFWGFQFPDNQEVKTALENYFQNIKLPCKDFAALTKSLHQQLMSMKNRGQQ